MTKEKKHFIYAIKCYATNKFYVGQTTHYNPWIRIRNHFYNERNCVKLNEAIEKHGKENFVCGIICEVNSAKELNDLEKFYIHTFNSFNDGYNSTRGGKGEKEFSNETKKKMSKSKTGEENPMYGRKHTEETKRKMKDARAKRIITEEAKLKMKFSSIGKKHTEETKRKLKEYRNTEEFLRNHSADRMGEKNPMYGVLKENHPMYGKKHTEEAKQKMKEARLRRGLTK